MPEENFYGTTDLNNTDPVLTPPGPFGATTIGNPIGPSVGRTILKEEIIRARRR